VYRKTGRYGSPELIATLSRGTTSYTDYPYIQTGDPNDIELSYDVRPYYSIEQTESTPYFQTIVFGETNVSKMDNSALNKSTAEELPTEYSVSNYPNPFNPTTTISYQLPKAGFVTIKVYDMIGREVAVLVNGNKSAGYYTVEFDATDLTSGIYVYSFQTEGYSQSGKMLLVK
jgi:hypothetical protein